MHLYDLLGVFDLIFDRRMRMRIHIEFDPIAERLDDHKEFCIPNAID